MDGHFHTLGLEDTAIFCLVHDRVLYRWSCGAHAFHGYHLDAQRLCSSCQGTRTNLYAIHAMLCNDAHLGPLARKSLWLGTGADSWYGFGRQH